MSIACYRKPQRLCFSFFLTLLCRGVKWEMNGRQSAAFRFFYNVADNRIGLCPPACHDIDEHGRMIFSVSLQTSQTLFHAFSLSARPSIVSASSNTFLIYFCKRHLLPALRFHAQNAVNGLMHTFMISFPVNSRYQSFSSYTGKSRCMPEKMLLSVSGRDALNTLHLTAPAPVCSTA